MITALRSFSTHHLLLDDVDEFVDLHVDVVSLQAWVVDDGIVATKGVEAEAARRSVRRGVEAASKDVGF